MFILLYIVKYIYWSRLGLLGFESTGERGIKEG